MYRKIVLAMTLALVGGLAASAQYMCEKEGTVLSYKSTAVVDGKTYDTGFTAKVTSVTKDDAGIVTSLIEETHKVPGNDFAEIKNNSSFTYNPSTELTVDHLLSADEFRRMILGITGEAMRQMGQTLTESMLAELEKAITVKGDLFIDLPAVPDAEAKVPNRSIKAAIEGFSMTMNLWNFKYLGFEDVEVPAGKYQGCMKVSYVLKQSSPQGNEKNNIVTWYAKGVGPVKKTTTDSKGNLVSEEILSEIK